MKKIAIDINGGDFAPVAPLNAAIKYAKDFPNTEVHIIGLEKDMDVELPKNVVKHITTQVITNEEEPARALRAKKDSSIVVGANLLKTDEIDAFLSSGSTGAQVAAATLIVRRIPGISRPALPGFLPGAGRKYPRIILDIGANIEAKPEHLHEYAQIANVYFQTMYGVKTPKVALLNIGTEEKKGTELYKETFQLLKADETLDFIGNVEARDVMTSEADIVVMDGFVGNMVLKNLEGNLMLFKNSLEGIFKKSIFTKLAYLVVRGGLNDFADQFDYTEIGGTPIFGVQKLMIKAHGSSNELALYNALKKAEEMAEKDFISQIGE